MGNRRHNLRIYLKKIRAAFTGSDSGESVADIKGIRASNAIKRAFPNRFLWLYYQYYSEFKRQPVDLDDLVDGLSFIGVKAEINKIYGAQDNA